MATRQEDFNTIKTLYDALSYQEDLNKRIEKEKEKIEWERSRKIDDYPAYVPKNFKKKAEDEQVSKQEAKMDKYFAVVALVFKTLALIFVIYRLASGAFPMFSEDWGVLFWVFGFWGVGTAIAFFLIIPSIGSKEGGAAPQFLVIIGIIDVVVGFLFSGEFDASDGISAAYCFWSEAAFTGAVAAGCSLAVGLLIPFFTERKSKKISKAIIANAELKDAEHLAEYERNKAAGEVVIAQQRAALAAEVTSNIATIRKRIVTYLQEIQKQQQIIDQTPGLAREDKNLYTVSILLRYFERYMVDSIKEAINKYDDEERQKAAAQAAAIAAAERTAALNSWIKSQQDALDAIAENQRRHNEKMEEKADALVNAAKDELDRLNR